MPIRPSVPSDDDDNDDNDRNGRDDIDRDGAGPNDAGTNDAGPNAANHNEADADPWSPDWDGEIAMPGETPRPPATDVSFHVDRRFMWVKFVAAVIFIATPLVAGSSVTGVVIGLAVGIGLAIYGLRDVLAPVRLAADADGITVVSGFVGQRRLAWNEIERVRLDERARYGGRQALLEIDEGDTLHFFSRYDLAMPPTEALDLLLEVRAARS